MTLTKVLGHHAWYTEQTFHCVDMTVDGELHLIHVAEWVKLSLFRPSLESLIWNWRFVHRLRQASFICLKYKYKFIEFPLILLHVNKNH